MGFESRLLLEVEIFPVWMNVTLLLFTIPEIINGDHAKTEMKTKN
jgi:hypothetical protein